MEMSELIRRLSALALVEIEPSEKEKLEHGIRRIIEMFNVIKELEIPNDVEPLYTTFFGERNVREDVETWNTVDIDGLDPSGVRLESRYIKSPRTL